MERYKPKDERKSNERNYLGELLERAKNKIVIIGFEGSNRHEGRTEDLVRAVLLNAEELGAFSILVNLSDSRMDLQSGTFGKVVPTYIPEKRNDDVDNMLELIRRAEAIIIGTPVYWFNRSSLVQRLFEHLTPLEDYGLLEGKVAGVIVTEQEEGGSTVAENLMLTLLHMGFVIPPYTGIFSRGPGRDLRWVQEDIGNLAGRILILVKRTKDVDWDSPSLPLNGS